MSALPWLDPDYLWFPPAEEALREPDGLLALGGDLSPARLLLAYRYEAIGIRRRAAEAPRPPRSGRSAGGFPPDARDRVNHPYD